ncbi:MAG: neuromedin U [Nodosilinea sp.]
MTTAIVNARSMGAIAATLPLALLIAGSTLVGSSWASESPAADSAAPVEEVGFTENPAMAGEITLPSPLAEAEVPVEQGGDSASGLCPELPCADLSTAASDLVPLPAAMISNPPSDSTLAQTPPTEAAPAADSTSNLAAAAQNPIANLISVPFQNNTNFGLGPNGDRTQNILNIQPVVPVPLSNDLLLVTRTILPIVLQPDAGGSGSIFGLGDLNPTFFFVPVTASNLTWGVGPTVVLPTATDRQTGAGKWSAGPAGVVVVSSGQWVYGGLATQIWSFAGDGSRPDVSQFLLQPFLNYNLPNGWYLTSSPIITANWNAAGGDQWTVPIGGGAGKLFRVGTQPLNASLQLYWNAVRPTNGADFSLRAQVQLLFPR